MKILIPILILSLVVLSAVFLFHYKQSEQAAQGTESTTQEVITGDPDDTIVALIKAAEAEAAASSAENEEASGVDTEIDEIVKVGDVYDDSEY